MKGRQSAFTVLALLLAAVGCVSAQSSHRASISIKPAFGEKAQLVWVGGSEIWEMSNFNNGTLALSYFDQPVMSFTNDFVEQALNNMRPMGEMQLLQTAESEGSSFLESESTVRARSKGTVNASPGTVANVTGSTTKVNKKFKVTGDLESTGSGNFIANGVKQWKLVRQETFQDSITGWNNDSTSNCGTSEDIFLGGHCKFAGGEVSKTYNNLPVHTLIKVRARYHFFDEWAGEVGFMRLEDKFVWTETQHWCDKILTWFCKKYGINACGNEFPDRLSSPVEVVMVHSASNLKVAFGSTLTRPACDASWGVDDIMIYVM